jgi:hypothetical protein
MTILLPTLLVHLNRYWRIHVCPARELCAKRQSMQFGKTAAITDITRVPPVEAMSILLSRR